MLAARVLGRPAPRSARPSIALLINPSEASRWLGRSVDRLLGRPGDPYPASYKHDIRAPWPQPSPLSPDGLAPTVLHVPEEEVRELLGTVVSRASKALWTGSPSALAFALRGEGLEPVDDAEFVRICSDTAFAWFLCPTLDPADRAVFAPLLAGRGTEDGLYKIDASAMAGVETLPGIHVAPTVALLARGPGGLSALGIRLGERLFTPADGDAWELMKYYVLQGNALQLLFLQHPREHFPFDAINAITKSALPRGHRLRALLEPHLRFQLPLDFSALYVSRSVGHNDQHDLYTPFPHRRAGFFHLITTGYAGLPGNSAYPPFSFKLGAPRAELELGRFLAAYWEPIHAFVAEALAGVSVHDPAVTRWADAAAQWVRGFPGAETMAREGTLAATVATIIHNLSVVHAVDHHSLWLQPIRKVSMRLRVPPPESPAGFVLDRRLLVTREDVFRYHMGRQMYVRAHVMEPLVEAEYDFRGEVGAGVVPRFREALRRVDRPEWHHFAPLSLISSSIQY